MTEQINMVIPGAEKGITPGALFGFVLYQELDGIIKDGGKPKRAIDFFYTVMLLGRIPIKFNQWVDGLVGDCESVLTDVVARFNQSDFPLTVPEVARLLAEGLEEGFVADWSQLGRQLCLDEFSTYQGQEKILKALEAIAHKK